MSGLIIFVKGDLHGKRSHADRAPRAGQAGQARAHHDRNPRAVRRTRRQRVTTQQIADRVDVAIGTLYLYAFTKAELLIMVQNEKFAAAIDDGLAAANAAVGPGVLEGVVALIRPAVACVREQIENGRTYLHELAFGDPAEPYRRAGLDLAARLEDSSTRLLTRDEYVDAADAATLARVITAIALRAKMPAGWSLVAPDAARSAHAVRASHLRAR